MDELNPKQDQAARAAGSVAVTAGAGTGKTHMLAARYLHHVLEHGLSPLSIVAVTFTERAADELRARIRRTLAESGVDAETAAEVDAAEISTIHALAARICRDFYDIAGIPPDFAVLDAVESPMWLAEKRGAAAAAVSPEIAEELGYGWLKQCLPQLLEDPITTEKALAVPLEEWQKAIDAEVRQAISDLEGCQEWAEACVLVEELHGRPDDLETARQCAAELIRAVRNASGIAAAVEAFDKSRPDRGRAENWPGDGKARIQPVLKALKAKVRAAKDMLSLEFGENDIELHRRIVLLRTAFSQAKRFLTEEKRREGVLDFADLEENALKILADPGGEALRHYGERWKAFLIDEFQDTSPVQEELLGLLTRECITTIVGDEKQAIYGFRGADIDVFGRFREALLAKGGVKVELDITYRSHAALTELTNRVFEPVLGSLHQSLKAARETDGHTNAPYISAAVAAKPEPGQRHRPDLAEAHHIAAAIKRIVSETQIYDRKLEQPRPAEYRDITVLARKWASLGTILDVLAAEGIPAVNTGGGNLLATREAMDAINLLRVLNEPTDSIPLVAVLRSPFFGISDETLFDAAATIPKGGSWWAAAASFPPLAGAKAVLDDLISVRRKLSAAGLLRRADELTGYSAVAANLPHGERREADWRGIFEMLDAMSRRGRGGLFDAVRHLELLLAAETDVPRPRIDAGNAVTLMTVHKSKGLEWPIVFVAALSAGFSSNRGPLVADRELGIAFSLEGEAYEKSEPSICKLIKTRNKRREEAEAKRVLYVAATRARDRVYLSACEEKSTSDMATLLPGLEAAGVAVAEIPCTQENSRVAAPKPRAEFAMPATAMTEQVAVRTRSLPATALRSYQECPAMFRFRHIDGHPGAGEGYALASNIGTLTHLALEHGIREPAGFRAYVPAADEAEAAEALRLAEAFRTNPAFAEFNTGECRHELPFTLEIGGISLSGSVDLAGDDFVLDFKTDGTINADHHKLQMWAYARALGKQRAVLAYLRHGEIREFGTAELEETGRQAEAVISAMAAGRFDPTPRADACGRCSYGQICDDKFGNGAAEPA